MNVKLLSKLWSIIYDLLILIQREGLQLPDTIQAKIDAAQTACTVYEEENED